MVLALVQQLTQLRPSVEYLLLTSEATHGELAVLDAANVRRVCVVRRSKMRESRGARLCHVSAGVRNRLAAVLPARAINWLERVEQAAGHRVRRTRLLQRLGADLLFCPLAPPPFYDRAVPLVCAVQDLPPHLRSVARDERQLQHWQLLQWAQLADRLICPSDHARRMVMQSTGAATGRAVTIRPGLHWRFATSAPEQRVRAGLGADPFLLYPAAFRAHKNHAMLLTAFGIFRSRHPDVTLRLVCVGEPGAQMEHTRRIVQGMGLGRWTEIFSPSGDAELASLFAGCRALVFPSLHEAFAVPVLDAMVFGKPVLCSRAAALPEVAGNAALYFDPRIPEELVQVIGVAAMDLERLERLRQAGYEHVGRLHDVTLAAEQHMEVFDEVVAAAHPTSQHSRG